MGRNIDVLGSIFDMKLEAFFKSRPFKKYVSKSMRVFHDHPFEN